MYSRLQMGSTGAVSPPHSTLVALLRERANLAAGRESVTFVTDGDNAGIRWTYGDLDQRARAIAAHLRQHASPGDRAALVYPPGIDFFAGFFGALYGGMTAVPAPPPNPAQLAVTLPRLLTLLR